MQDDPEHGDLGVGYAVEYVYLVQDESGAYVAIGELQKTDPDVVDGSFIGFNLRFLDSEGDVVFGDYAVLNRLAPDENGLIPFAMDVDLPRSVSADDELSAEAQSCGTWPVGDVYSGDITFDVSDAELNAGDGYYAYNLSGKVTNTGTVTNPYEFAVADFHREDGLLLGTAQVDVGPGLEPDQGSYIDSGFNFYSNRGERILIDTPLTDISFHLTGSDGEAFGCMEGGEWSELPLIDPDEPFDIGTPEAQV